MVAIRGVSRTWGLGDVAITSRREGKVATFEQSTVPAPQGERGDDPLDVRVVVDQSPSEQAVDPLGYRMIAARRILDLLQHDLKHKADTMSVIHFSEKPRPILGATSPHTKAGRRALRQILRDVGGGAGTDIRAALLAAARLPTRHRDGYQVVVLLTDGMDMSTPDELRQAIQMFQTRAVHVISIAEPLPEVWHGLPLGSTTVVSSMSQPDEVEWTVAHAIYGALGLGWSGALAPPTRRR